jgi:hypothetical protein
LLDQTQSAIDDIELPPNVTPIDAALRKRDQDKARATLTPLIGSLRNILSRVRQSVHDFLVTTEEELNAGRNESRFFDGAHLKRHRNSLQRWNASRQAVTRM